MNPLSQQMQAQGRGNDSVLVHMTPQEVGGLQALAMATGGSLTINPQTGFPEAGFLDSILPMLAGAAGGALGIDPYLVAAGAGLAQGAITGNLEKGLTAGLSAYGGASLGRTLNPEGTIGGFSFNTSAATVPTNLATANLAATAPSDVAGIENMYSPEGLQNLYPTPPTPPAPQGMFDKFGTAASAGLEGTGLEKFAPYAAAFGLATPFLAGNSQTYKAPEPEKVNYAGPYKPMPRKIALPSRSSNYLRNSSEHMFFPDSNPYPGYLPADSFVAPTIRMAEGGLLPRAAPRTGLMAPETPRSSSERTFNFPESNYVPPAVATPAAAAPSAGLAALTQQYPTATKEQVAELSRAVDQGGDLNANLSAMAAYSPSGNYTSLQPWSPDYKGDKYRRAHPTDAFGNPVGWTPTAEDEASRERSLAVSGGKAGYAPLEFPDQYRPDDEWLMNNPWNYGVQTLGGNVMPGDIGTRAGERSSQGSTVVAANAAYQNQKNVESQRQAALAANRADNTAENYALYGGPDAPEDTGRYVSPLPSSPPASSGSSTFLGALNSIIPSLSGSGAAPGAAPSGPGLSDLYSGNRTLGSFTGFSSQPDPNAPEVGLGLGQALNAATGYAGLPGTFIDFLRNTYGGGLASAPGTNTLGIVGNTATSPGIGAQLGAKFNRLLGGTNNNAAGGVNLEDGSFVVDARTVAELGNGSSGAGQEVLARLGGRPIRGPGDGVSDSIRANIGGEQEARVARDEVKFDPEAVKRLGRGNPKKGADRLYDMMKKAEKARKSASRGKDTGLRALAGAR